MVHVHGRRVQRNVESTRRASSDQLVAVAIDAGKSEALALVADFTGERLCPPFNFTMNRAGIGALADKVQAAIGGRQIVQVRVGVEASGYHLPLLSPGVLPCDWEVVELNPAHVAMQRKVNGQRGIQDRRGRCDRDVRPARCWSRQLGRHSR
jgi:hypothetical protein